MAERQSSVTTIFHIIDGKSPPMYLIDAKAALAHHRDEWRDKPWKPHEVEAYKRRKAKEAAAASSPPAASDTGADDGADAED